MDVLLDSCILIDHFNRISAATGYLKQAETSARVSAITWAEVLTGLVGTARQSAVRFLDCFAFLPIDRDVADLAAELRRVHHWKLPDAIQAAVAQHHGLHLATRNTSDFNPKRHVFVVVPYTLPDREA
jgi:hypothetical protein